MIDIREYTRERIEDVLDFERRLRAEENFWGWEIDDAYVNSVQKSFANPAFSGCISLLAYVDERVIGRIDCSMLHSRFDGSTKAYLDWICVVKSARHMGAAQALLTELRARLKARGIDTLIALTAANEEAQRFYRHVENSEMRDTGIWIDI